MSEGDAPAERPAKPDVEGSGRISPIWIIPVVALLVAAYVAYEAVQAQGPKVVLSFESGQGLEPGKSKVKYLDVDIGLVDAVRVRDMAHVEVHVSLDPRTEGHLTEGTQWWVVRPRVGAGGVTGLGTILSGAYVTLKPGPPGGAPKRAFTGMERPPLPAEETPGLRLTLHTAHLGGLDVGSGIFFRDIHVGEVLHYALSDDGTTVDVEVVIGSSHALNVRKNSRFWNAGGLELSVGPEGLDLKTETLKSILTGGIAFDSPGGGEPAENGDAFWLASSHAAAHEMNKTHGGLRLVLESGALGGIGVGDAVMYREVPVGAVVATELTPDGRRVRTQINVDRRYAGLVRSNSKFWNASGFSADLGLTGLHVHAESLKSLISGGVAFATPPKPGRTVKDGSVFELHPEAKDDWIDWETDYEPRTEDSEEHHSVLGSFFHHEEKTEEEAKAEDPTPAPTHEKKKHGFLKKLFGGDD